MKINSKFIRRLNPCEDGILDFENKHPDFNGKLSDLLALEDISYNNKIWLATKVAPLKTLQIWSVECAEFVLDNFEREFPNDTRVRDCLEVVKKVINGELGKSAAWSAESAARSAAESARSEKDQEGINLSILIALLENKGL